MNKNAKAVHIPGSSRSKAFQKREKTIGVQYNRLGIVNEMNDARVGERRNWSNEEKAARRYVEVKKRTIGKRRFNLNDEDDYDKIDDSFIPEGKDITQVQRFERLDDDESDNQMDKDVMAIANFGGGKLNTKVQNDDGRYKKLTRKEIFHEILSKSKEAKMIKQVAKDEVEVMTENLDEKFKLIRDKGVLLPFNKPLSNAERVADDYDEIVRFSKKFMISTNKSLFLVWYIVV